MQQKDKKEQAMTQQKASLAIRKSVIVRAPQQRAFDVFTSGMSTWWPLSTHHIGSSDAVSVVLEQTGGGRWFERGADGSECNWGHVVEWERPDRVVLTWEINADWQYDARIQSRIEVTFTPEGGDRTRVELAQTGFETFGDRAEEMAEGVAGEGGWGSLLESFVRTVEAKP
jgi:uncharacterized protein YndB with AHSA1/START domain